MSVGEVLAGARSWWIETGDVLDGLRAMPSESVHCVCTSPPYWGLRSYGVRPSVWGGDPDCAHDWQESEYRVEHHGPNHAQPGAIDSTASARVHQSEARIGPVSSATCGKCGAWMGCLGLEPTPWLFTEHLVAVFREIKRVLRKDGTVWLNLGDSYASSPPDNKATGAEKWRTSGLHGAKVSDRYAATLDASVSTKRNTVCPGFKPKDLIGTPWRVAFALQEDGWWLRSAITWCKRACMPESVQDRPTSATEMVFLLAKSERYFYDADAVREDCESGPSDIKKMVESLDRIGGKHKDLIDPLSKASSATAIGRKRAVGSPTGRNLRNFWLLGPEPFPDAHFATFPTEIPRRAILAGCPEGGVVLDPFAGSGTTLMVALRHGRRAIGLELNQTYVAMAQRRIVGDAPMFNTPDLGAEAAS